MTMIARHFARNNVQFVLDSNWAQNIPCPNRHLSGQNPFAILGYPDQVHLEVSFGMCLLLSH